MSIPVKCILVFALSMVPVFELRGAIPLGFGFGLPLYATLILSIFGNILIVPFIILLFKRVLLLMKNISFTKRFADFIELRAQNKSKKVQNMQFIGLMLFVAVPLPGTGAWTASMIAGITDMKVRHAAPPICLGVMMAATIVTLASYGIFKIIGL